MSLIGGVVGLMLAGCSSTPKTPSQPAPSTYSEVPPVSQGKAYSKSELVNSVSKHLGVNSESAASAIERIFKDRGEPVAYITGEERSAAVAFGVRYGKGTLWMKDGRTERIYWQGSTIGLDVGGDASKVFTLVYGLNDIERLYQRFPGADGGVFLIAGMAVNYQRANGITLAPVRSGVGARVGANVGYTNYTKKRKYLPF